MLTRRDDDTAILKRRPSADVALYEQAWVLERSYAFARAEVHAALTALLEQDHLRVESPALVLQSLMKTPKSKASTTGGGGISTCSEGGIICTGETYKGDSVPLRRAA